METQPTEASSENEVFFFCFVFLEMVVRATVEEKEGGSNVNTDQEDRSTQEKSGNKGVPKKLFKWNEEVRLVLEIPPPEKFQLAFNN